MDQAAQNSDVLRFGAFELDRAGGELRKGGTPVKLKSQQFQLLALLAGRAGQVVSREEIRAVLWDGETFVDFDQSINVCVNKLREALDDDPHTPRYIETLPRKGYRFIAPIVDADRDRSNGEAGPASTSAVVASRRWLFASGGIAILGIALAATGIFRQHNSKPIQSLAVLPLENLSHDPEQDYFAEGMTDELITDLAKISSLRIVSRTSVMQYKGTRKPVPQIAKELGVDAVLEGTVTHDRDRVRITAQLIGAVPEKHLWAEKYETSLGGILNVQDSVAKAVAQAIQITLTLREKSLLTTSRGVDPAAYEAYLHGRYWWERPGEEHLKRSRDYFEQAIEKDPRYALAWAGLADTYCRLASWGVLSSQDARPRARAAAQRAIELDGTLVEPLVTLAEVKVSYEWDWDGAERLFKRAIDLSPNYGDAHHGYATFLAAVGRKTEAVVEARRGHEVEPLSSVFAGNVVWKLYLAGQYDEAEKQARILNERDGYIVASLYLQTGRQHEALAMLQKDIARPHPGVLELMYLGHALGVTGARSEGRKVLEQMRSLSQERYVPPEYIAVVYEGLGEREQALRWFERAFAERSMNIWILPDPQLDSLRSDPRFKKIMRGMGLPQ